MSFTVDFDEMRNRARDLAQTGVAKAKQFTDTGVAKGKELTEIGKLKVQNATEQDTIKKAYVEIGKLYYAERGTSPETAYTVLCQQITQCMNNIEKNNARIADLKSSETQGEEGPQDSEAEPDASDFEEDSSQEP